MKTSIAWPAIAFLATALVGVWAAYDREAAWIRFGMIALGVSMAVCIAWIGQIDGQRALGVMGLCSALLAVGVGVYFLLAHDWIAAEPVESIVLQRAGLWIQAHRPAVPALSEVINSNLAGGWLAVTLPLGVGGLSWAWAQRYWAVVAISVAALLLALAVLVLTVSRGAWAGLAAGGLAGAYLRWRTSPLHRLDTPRRGMPSWLDDAVLGSTLLLLLGGFWAIIALPSLGSLWRPIAAIAGADETLAGRIEIWRWGLALVRDYAFTGSGLGDTMMVLSTYGLLLHVGFIEHAHNLFLQIAIEQGVLGLVAFLWLAGLALRAVLRPTSGQVQSFGLRIAALVSLVALLVHGMVDAPLYSGAPNAPLLMAPPIMVMFLPIGMALAFDKVLAASPEGAARTNRRRMAPIPWLAVAPLALAVLALPSSRAALQANLGAVAQTHAELSVYSWPKWPIQDAVRRSADVNLTAATAHYWAALSLNPTNATANRRLGQIELSLGQYEAAHDHLEAAYASAPSQRATRQLLGESYAVAGQIEQAVALWRTVDLSQNQLVLREWWYSKYLRDQQRATWFAQAKGLTERATVDRPANTDLR